MLKDSENKKNPSKIWIFILIYILLIYTTLPIMRTVLNYIYSTIGKESLSIVVNIFLVAVPVTLVVFLIRKKSKNHLLVLFPIIVTMAFIFMLDRPEERLHFLEYGLLGFVVLKTFDKELNYKRLILAIVFVTAVGALDEFIQLLLPNRVGDLRDVCMNAVGGALGVWVGKFWYLH